MADMKQIGGSDAMELKVGYIFSGEVAHGRSLRNTKPMECLCKSLRNRSRWQSVDQCRDGDTLESKQADESLTEIEQKLLSLCKAAEAAGLGDIVINPE